MDADKVEYNIYSSDIIKKPSFYRKWQISWSFPYVWSSSSLFLTARQRGCRFIIKVHNVHLVHPYVAGFVVMEAKEKCAVTVNYVVPAFAAVVFQQQDVVLVVVGQTVVSEVKGKEIVVNLINNVHHLENVVP